MDTACQIIMFDIKENLRMLPDKPGVYLYKDKFGEIIYVGKALSLRKRVRQYFQSPENLPAKVRALVDNIDVMHNLFYLKMVMICSHILEIIIKKSMN